MSVFKFILCILFYSQLSAGIFYTIKRVVDADTFILNNGEKIRLIGVDSPEKHDSEKLTKQSLRNKISPESIKKLGKIASNFAIKTLSGKQVEIEFDEINIKNNHKDPYNRLLVYLYFKPDKLKPQKRILFNRLLIESGMAKVFRKFYFQYIYEFKRLEKEAKNNKTGFWGNEYRQFFI